MRLGAILVPCSIAIGVAFAWSLTDHQSRFTLSFVPNRRARLAVNLFYALGRFTCP